jgi:hypothetical protein
MLSERQIQNDKLVIDAFAKLGLTVVPRVDVLTHKRWLDKGLLPKEGEKPTTVWGVGNLFHLSQVQPIAPVSPPEPVAPAEVTSTTKAKKPKLVVVTGTGGQPGKD